MGHVHNGLQVGANPVICGVVYQDGNGLRVLGNGFGHLLPPHPQGDAQMLVHFWVHIHRDGAAKYEVASREFLCQLISFGSVMLSAPYCPEAIGKVV